jgi:hypothetical protein
MEPLSLHCLNISSLSPAAIYFLNVDYREYPRSIPLVSSRGIVSSFFPSKARATSHHWTHSRMVSVMHINRWRVASAGCRRPAQCSPSRRPRRRRKARLTSIQR